MLDVLEQPLLQYNIFLPALAKSVDPAGMRLFIREDKGLPSLVSRPLILYFIAEAQPSTWASHLPAEGAKAGYTRAGVTVVPDGLLELQ